MNPDSRRRKIGNTSIDVFALGLGCMGMSEFYGATDDAQSLATLQMAFDNGVNHFDTADTYGLGHNETLLAQFMVGKRSSVTVATKFGIVRKPGEYTRTLNNTPAYIRSACEGSLKRLGVDVIDLYYAHRVSRDVPLEESVGAMADLVKAGKVRAIGLCEVSAQTLRRAHAIHPISAVQSEYSLWTRDPEAEVLPACRELGISLVAYSPLGRGFLTGDFSLAQADAKDFRQHLPRFQAENVDKNRKIVEIVKTMATTKACTAAQLSLAWLLAQGAAVIPIPGTRRSKYLLENIAAADVVLSAADLAHLSALLPMGSAAGQRYTEEGMKGLNA
jgi:aryl-alcohol dehydrogenase-like predicted oxidoreductase